MSGFIFTCVYVAVSAIGVIDMVASMCHDRRARKIMHELNDTMEKANDTFIKVAEKEIGGKWGIE